MLALNASSGNATYELKGLDTENIVKTYIMRPIYKMSHSVI